MGEMGHFTRAQLVAGFWALLGLYNVGFGVKRALADGLGGMTLGYLALGVGGLALCVVYLRNPDRVADGRQRVDKRYEAIIAFVLVFVAVVSAYALLA